MALPGAGPPRSRRARGWIIVAVVVALLVASLLLTNDMIDVLHDITGGREALDIIVGVLVLWVPFAALVTVAVLVKGHRRVGRLTPATLVLYVPLIALEPFRREGTDVPLQQRLDLLLPGYLLGLVLGFVVVAVPMLGLGLFWKPRRRGSPS